MSEVLQANIFFFVTGIAVIVFTLLLCVLLYHLIRIVKSIRTIVDRIEEGSEVIAEDMSNFRKYFTDGSLISTVLGIFFGQRGPSKKRTSPFRKTPKKGSTKTTLSIKDEEQ